MGSGVGEGVGYVQDLSKGQVEVLATDHSRNKCRSKPSFTGIGIGLRHWVGAGRGTIPAP